MKTTKIDVEFFEDIAEEVKRIERAMVGINQSRLSEKAILVLLKHSTGENEATLKRVLYALENIDRYLK